MATITLTCDHCNEEFEKEKGEYNRRIRLGKTEFYCSLSCGGKSPKSIEHINRVRSSFPVWEKANPSHQDEFSIFRPTLKTIRSRCKERNKDNNLTLEHLKDVWEKQQGVCPFTNFHLELKTHTELQQGKSLTIRSASLDRIDNSLDYVQGNVRWVSVMFNFARNTFSDADVIEFARAVTLGGERQSIGNTS